MKIFQICTVIGIMTVSGTALAFNMPWLDSGEQNKASENFIEVFTGGGGPTSSRVNVNSPQIGDCSAPDANNRYRVSTCEPEVEQQLELMEKNYVAAFMEMAREFSSVMMQQMQIIGSFFDAKEQLETQGDIRTLTAQAHKDYQPSEQMCVFGSGIRSLANTEERASFNRQVMGAPLLNDYKNTKFFSSAEGFRKDLEARVEEFKTTYCDPHDHNNQLWEFCYGEAYNEQNPPSLPNDVNPDRFNKDIDYSATFWHPLTLNVDFTNAPPPTSSGQTSDPEQQQEEDLMALARHLYWERALNLMDKNEPNTLEYQRARALMAKMSLAHNSFLNIAGMKSKAPIPSEEGGSQFLLSVLKQFGDLQDQDIIDLYGETPSYYAQMEILTKRIYQNPQFYTNLYDKPANIDRINATLETIQLMQLRDRFHSQTRREMLLAGLLETALRPVHKSVQSDISKCTDTSC